MPRFYFHTHSDIDAEDEEGVELPDLVSARREAIRNARVLACEEVAKGRLMLGHRIDIADPSGAILASVTYAEAIDVMP